jgi:hypothetical protein
MGKLVQEGSGISPGYYAINEQSRAVDFVWCSRTALAASPNALEPQLAFSLFLLVADLNSTHDSVMPADAGELIGNGV